jgi:signal peptidase II
VTRRLLPFLLSAALFVVDRLSKVWIDRNIGAFDTWAIIPGFFNIIHAENRGMAFSLMADWTSAWRGLFLIGVSSAVLIFVVVMLWQAKTLLQRSALTLVLGGAAGNLYDRVVRGSVTDFLDVYVGDYHWPTFNVADSAITVGALLLVSELIWSRGKHVS